MDIRPVLWNFIKSQVVLLEEYKAEQMLKNKMDNAYFLVHMIPAWVGPSPLFEVFTFVQMSK